MSTEVEMQYVTVASVEELPPGATKSVDLGNMGLALVNLDGTIHALDNLCPHAGGPLGEGEISGETLVCPWHGWKFEIRTGTCLKNPTDSWRVPCYDVRVTDTEIQVRLPAIPER